jgi:hypothetical protein
MSGSSARLPSGNQRACRVRKVRGISHGPPVRLTPNDVSYEMALMAVFQAMGDEMPENFGVGSSGTERKHDLPVPCLSRVCRTSTGRHSGYHRRVSDELLSRRASRSLTGSRRCRLGAAAPSSAHRFGANQDVIFLVRKESRPQRNTVYQACRRLLYWPTL